MKEIQFHCNMCIVGVHFLKHEIPFKYKGIQLGQEITWDPHKIRWVYLDRHLKQTRTIEWCMVMYGSKNGYKEKEKHVLQSD